MTVKSGKKIGHLNNFGEKFTSPHNRAIMGITALVSQPLFDIYNNDVDKKTQNYSCAKDIAKIVVGTAVGVIIRALSIKYAKRGCMVPKAGETLKKWQTAFMPDGVSLEEQAKYVKAHANTIGTVIGTATGLVTNFIIDMPLTKLFTNYLTPKVQEARENSKGGKQ